MNHKKKQILPIFKKYCCSPVFARVSSYFGYPNDTLAKVKKIMETDDFKRLKYYQDKYNDSLNRNNVKDLPRRPGPEGVLKNLMKLCKERGDCPNE